MSVTPEQEEKSEYFVSNQEKLSAAERFKDPQLILGLFSIFFPFIFLVFAYTQGWVGN